MGKTYAVSAIQLPATLRQAGEAARVAIVRGLQAGAFAGVPVMHAATRDKDAFNIGEYLRAWRVDVAPGGAKLFNDRPYAAVIEHGRRPGGRMPPRALLARWAQRKLQLSEDAAQAASFAIARAIQRRGQPARKVMGDAQPALVRAAEREVARSLRAGGFLS